MDRTPIIWTWFYPYHFLTQGETLVSVPSSMFCGLPLEASTTLIWNLIWKLYFNLKVLGMPLITNELKFSMCGFVAMGTWGVAFCLPFLALLLYRDVLIINVKLSGSCFFWFCVHGMNFMDMVASVFNDIEIYLVVAVHIGKLKMKWEEGWLVLEEILMHTHMSHSQSILLNPPNFWRFVLSIEQ